MEFKDEGRSSRSGPKICHKSKGNVGIGIEGPYVEIGLHLVSSENRLHNLKRGRTWSDLQIRLISCSRAA